MKHLFCKYTCFFFFFASLSARAQVADSGEWDAYEPDSLYAIRNAVKVDPVQIIIGDYSIYYERILSRGYSVELGLGFTRRNYAADWFDYTLDNLGRNVDIETGLSARLAFRRYLKRSEELDGWYVSAGVGYRSYTTVYNVIDTAGVLTGDAFTDVRNYTTGHLAAGFQALGLASNIFADFYLGISLQYRDFQVVRADDIYNPQTYTVNPEESVQIGLVVGVKLGVGF